MVATSQSRMTNYLIILFIVFIFEPSDLSISTLLRQLYVSSGNVVVIMGMWATVSCCWEFSHCA
jgi:hypothetical protein